MVSCMKKVQKKKTEHLVTEDVNLSSGELKLSERPYATEAMQAIDWEGQSYIWFQQWNCFSLDLLVVTSVIHFTTIQNSFLLEKRDGTIFPVGWRGRHKDYYMYPLEAIGNRSDVTVIEK